jgi:hypothetical protein
LLISLILFFLSLLSVNLFNTIFSNENSSLFFSSGKLYFSSHGVNIFHSFIFSMLFPYLLFFLHFILYILVTFTCIPSFYFCFTESTNKR